MSKSSNIQIPDSKIKKSRKYFLGTWNLEFGTNFRSHSLWLLIILAAGLLIRTSLLGLHRLHMDECLYSSYAIRMVTHGDLGLNGGLAVDKPPLLFYALAASFLALGVSENSARMPNIIFSLITAVFIYRLVLRIYGSGRTGLLSAFFAAASVMYTLFSVTAFQDVLMIMLFVMSLYYMAERRVFASSLCFFLSIAAKPMTVFLFPLWMLFAFQISNFRFQIERQNLAAFVRAAAYVLVPLFLWSALLANPRLGIFKFFITQQPEAMSVSFDIISRLKEWYGHSEYLLNGHAFLLLAASGVLLSAILNKNRSDAFMAASIIYIYLLLSAVKFRLFDRYVLVLIPFVSIAAARAVDLIIQWVGKLKIQNFKVKSKGNKPQTLNFKPQTVIIAVIAILYIIPAYNLPAHAPAYGALYTDSDGFEQVANFLKSKEDRETRIVYYGHTISWYGYFYLAESAFYSAEPVYDTDAVLRLNDGRKNFIVIDTGKAPAEDTNLLTSSFRKVFSVPYPGGGEKYMVLEN